MKIMFAVLVVLVVILALIFIGVVLAQESKGGVLSSRFEYFKKSFGYQRSMSFVEKITWILAGIIVVLCVVACII